jgi:hypothetical protein
LAVDELQDDPIAALAINLSPAAIAVLKLLEEKMLKGEASWLCMKWMEDELGINKEQGKRLEALILFIWAESGTNIDNFVAKRDKHRARYMDLYRRARDAGKLHMELKVLEAISRMEGFDAPAQLDININGRSMITSQARNNVIELMEKATALADRATVPGPPKNGKNGSNGHKMIDVKSDDSDDEEGD